MKRKHHGEMEILQTQTQQIWAEYNFTIYYMCGFEQGT